MINHEINEADNYSHIYYANLRLPLLSLLRNSPRKVLEVGCGSALSLEHLKNTTGCETVGVELRGDIAEKVKARGNVDRVWNIDITKENLPEEPHSFDTIILSHVIEHFQQPNEVLNKLKDYSAPNAQFLIAVPNIRHFSVIIPLVLKGKFNYSDSGILDHTHMRFFTRSSIENLLTELDFEIVDSEFELLGPRSKFADKLSLGLLRPFCGYAINILASYHTSKTQ